MTITVLKTFFQKQSPVRIKYRNYKHFDDTSFTNELSNKLDTIHLERLTYSDFHNAFMSTLEIHAPLKEKFVRANNAPFMNKELSKAIMKRSKLRNRYNKFPTNENLTIYKKQRNLCVKLSRKTKRDYYSNLNINKITDNKQFWGSVKPLFSDKQKNRQKIVLIEEESILSKEYDVAEKMNQYFVNAVSNLDIPDPFFDSATEDFTGVEKALKKFKEHPSFLKIKENYTFNEEFHFNNKSVNEIEYEIGKLNLNKITPYDDIPAKILYKNRNIVSPFVTRIYDNAKNNCNFPTPLKLGNVTPVHKKGDKTNKENYRPINILPTVSKNFEKSMYNEIAKYIEKYLSPYLCGFRKTLSTQHCLAVLVEQWRKSIDHKKYAGGILTDLSKAFDCLNHDLLIAKLHAYNFDENSLKMIYNYLSERKQRPEVFFDFRNPSPLKWTLKFSNILFFPKNTIFAYFVMS